MIAMKIRTIAAGALLPVVIIVALFAPKIVAALCVGIMCAIASYEMLNTTKLVRHPRMLLYTMVMAFLVAIWSYLGSVAVFAAVLAFVFFFMLFTEVMLSNMKISYTKVCLCLTSGLLLPYMLCAIVRILMQPDGRFFVLVPFAVAFISDSFAYLVGMKFGKHKLSPVISPNKSVEGVIGGMLVTIAGMVIYGLILQFGFHFQVNYLYMVIYAVVGTCAGVFGDLCFSVIKRQTGIKDYGNIIPGHGGILDRFDSMITVAPLMEVLLFLLPIAVKG
jgi:phosphatidate cytidylyltransferase